MNERMVPPPKYYSERRIVLFVMAKIRRRGCYRVAPADHTAFRSKLAIPNNSCAANS